MVCDAANRDRIAGQPGEQRSGILLRQQMQASFLQIPQTRREAVAEERHEAEDMVGGPAGIGVMFFDRQTGGMVEQPVEDIGCLARRRRDHPACERVILVRDVGVEADPGLVAVTRVDLTDRSTAPPGVEELAVAPEGT